MTNKTILREQMSATRIAFHELLKRVPDEKWLQKIPGSDWTASHQFWHLVLVQRMYTHTIHAFRQGHSYPLKARALLDLIAVGLSYRLNSKHPKALVAEEYDRSFETLCTLMDFLSDDEFKLRGKFAGMNLNISGIFKNIIGHFEEHAATVKTIIPS